MLFHTWLQRSSGSRLQLLKWKVAKLVQSERELARTSYRHLVLCRELIARCNEREGSEADDIEGLIVQDHAFTSVLDKLVDG